MTTRYSNTQFISRNNFNRLCEAKYSVDQIFKLCSFTDYKESKLSTLTLRELKYFSHLSSHILMESPIFKDYGTQLFPLPFEEEKEYVENKVKEFFRPASDCLEEPADSEKPLKCYEIVPAIYEERIDLLVILESNFTKVVFESKDTLLELYLNLFKHALDNNGSLVGGDKYLRMKYSEQGYSSVLCLFDRK